MVGQSMPQVVLLIGLVVYWRPRAVAVGQSRLGTHDTDHHPPGEEWVGREYIGRQCVSVRVCGEGVCVRKSSMFRLSSRWRSLWDIHYRVPQAQGCVYHIA